MILVAIISVDIINGVYCISLSTFQSSPAFFRKSSCARFKMSLQNTLFSRLNSVPLVCTQWIPLKEITVNETNRLQRMIFCSKLCLGESTVTLYRETGILRCRWPILVCEHEKFGKLYHKCKRQMFVKKFF